MPACIVKRSPATAHHINFCASTRSSREHCSVVIGSILREKSKVKRYRNPWRKQYPRTMLSLSHGSMPFFPYDRHNGTQSSRNQFFGLKCAVGVSGMQLKKSYSLFACKWLMLSQKTVN